MQGLATFFDRSWSVLHCYRSRRRRTGIERNRQWYSVSTPKDSTGISGEPKPFDDVNSHFVDQNEWLGPVGIEGLALALLGCRFGCPLWLALWLPASAASATTATTTGTARESGTSAGIGRCWCAGEIG